MRKPADSFTGPVTPEWFEKSEPLAIAWRKFGDPMYLERLAETAAEFQRIVGVPVEAHFPPPASPAVLERETNLPEGDAKKAFDVLQAYSRWRQQSHASVMRFLLVPTTRHLIAMGAPHNTSARFRWIPEHAWFRLKEDGAMSGVVRGEGIVYFDVRVAERKPVKADETIKLSQDTVNTWILAFYQKAHDDGRTPPKGRDDAFPACKAELGATDAQLRNALRLVPEDLRPKRGKPSRTPYNSGV